MEETFHKWMRQDRGCAMAALTVQLSDELRDKAMLAARQRGLSLDEFVQICLSSAVDRERDPLFCDSALFSGEVPADISKNHDRYLYGGDS